MRQREAMETHEYEQRKMLQKLTSKMATSSISGTERASRKRSRKILIPEQCRVSTFNDLLQAKRKENACK